MAHLPPKVPIMTQNCPSFTYPMMPMTSFGSGLIPTTTTTAAAATASTTLQPSWVDEFLDFASVRRNVHRRSASDSIAFIPLVEECQNSHCPNAGNTNFDRLDDEQLMNMFPDDMPMVAPPIISSSNPSNDPSSPSEQNSNEGEKPTPPDHNQRQPKTEAGEVDSTCNPDPQKPTPPSAATSGDTIVDPKRVKRILANRQSAQRSRVRKLQYISDLERSITTLQTEVSTLSPRVAFLDHQRLILNVDNSALKQRIAALAQDKIFKDAHQEALKKEIERLRQVYHQQSLKKKMGHAAAATAAPTSPPPPSTSDNTGCTDKDQLLN
ncbi:basic leucine zipper 34-like [Cornus florida]|uniref:basic leucine zipper 34-like n=1 Tax=Cornus florida TaxID=4283 RepID=UPI0028976576|nr:basic leucine zipper 34-like [Cornus florida]